MTTPSIYVVTDIEADGPRTGENSMLSFASVAVDKNGKRYGEFEAVLAPLPEASPNAETMRWFASYPLALAAATLDPQPPGEVMLAFVDWVKALPGRPIFAAQPLVFDGAWIDYYLRRFTPHQLYEGPERADRLFNASAICIKSFASGRLGQSPGRRAWPEAWLGDEAHTHKAIDDARGYANLLVNLINHNAGTNHA